MKKTHHSLPSSVLSVSDLNRNAKGWLLDGEVRQLSPNTLAKRKNVVEKLVWFLRQQEAEQVGAPGLRAFLA